MSKALEQYEDLAVKQDRKALMADAKLICKDEKVIAGKRKVLNATIVDVINAMVRQGEALQRMSKHEQVSFSFINSIAEQLPWGKDAREVFDMAKRRVAFASNLKGEIRSLEDIAPDSRRQIFLHLGLLSSGERDSGGPAPQVSDPFSKFLTDVIKLKQELQKCDRVSPLQDRSKTELENFLSDTQWVDDYRKQAKKLLDA